MISVLRSALLFAACLGLIALSAAAQPDDRRASAELIADHSVVAAGTTFYAGLKMKMQPGWHIYWKNPGDAGLPPRLIPEEGTSIPSDHIGDFLWPLPDLLPVAPGRIMDYGYSDEVIFAFPVTLPAEATGNLTLVAEADYLICEDICIPESADVSLSLAIGDARINETDGRQIASWIARVPARFSGEARFDDTGPAWTLSLGRAGGLPDQARVRFFPYGHEISHPADQPARTGGNGFSLALTPDPESAVGELLEGVVRIDVPGMQPLGYEIAAMRGAALAGTGDIALPSFLDPARASGLSWMRLAVFAGFALLGGLILNLMPCVLPVLSMKAIGMLQAAATGRASEIRAHGLWYTAGVVLSFVVLAGTFLIVRQVTGFANLGFQLQHAPTVVVLILIMFAIGLWLMGVFELGSSVQNIGSGLAHRGGAAGAFFTGILAAVVGAPCVGPFLGAALGAVMNEPAPAVMIVFLAMGLGMALPFLLLSFVPGLQRVLPRPGKWMETLKQAFAFPMFLTAAWLVSVLAGLAGPGAVGWTIAGATLIAFALWLRRSGGHVRRVLAAPAVLAGFVMPALLADTSVHAATSATSSFEQAGTGYGDDVWSPEKVAGLLSEGRPVFVDFTASWCASCQVNKLTTLRTRKVQEAFDRAGVAFLVADFTRQDPVIAEELKRRGRAGVPLYLWYRAGASEPQILPELLSPELVIGLVEAD